VKVAFSNTIKLAGLGLVPWVRLGPEQWLQNYAIATLHGWDMPKSALLPEVYALDDTSERIPELPKVNMASLLKTKEFQQLLNNKVPGYDLLTYKPVDVPVELADRKFLMVDKKFTIQYENKAWFRQKFSDVLKFPNFKILYRADLNGTEQCYQDIAAGRTAFVVQDSRLSGGKGTHIIRSYEDYQKALAVLPNKPGSEVVISDLVAGAKERSVQACVTGSAVYVGPLQKQIVSSPLLANMNASGDKFCGAVIDAGDQLTAISEQAQQVVQHIGEALKKDGYKGIFGVDFLLGESGELFVIEVNPRITGVTPLLTALYPGESGIPFYLLHILELGDYPYEITDDKAKFDASGSLLVLHSHSNVPVTLTKTLKSGTYHMVGDTPELVSRSLQIADLNGGEFIFQEYVPLGTTVKPGGRLATMQYGISVIDKNYDKLYNETVQNINAVYNELITTPIETNQH
jgi:hypothetical protein